MSTSFANKSKKTPTCSPKNAKKTEKNAFSIPLFKKVSQKRLTLFTFAHLFRRQPRPRAHTRAYVCTKNALPFL